MKRAITKSVHTLFGLFVTFLISLPVHVIKKLLIIITLVCFAIPLLFYGIAKADLILMDDIVLGEQSILRDTDSGLDWLAITQETTLGKSFSYITSLLETGEYADFRFANQSELDQLANNSGYDENNTNSEDKYNSLYNLVINIGPTRTYNMGEFPDTMYNFADLNGMLEPTMQIFEDYGGILGATAYLYIIPVGEISTLRSFNVSMGYGYSSGYQFTSTNFMLFPGFVDETADPNRGAFLVRTTPGNAPPVPEPATLLLFGSGLLGLAGLRKKFKK